ncbi:unnamed protein product [Cuscuta epithymum]|uniref:Uncharacterized protein n=1 Tax=Cuscuta epithymum TaxID=186058 RepID=A0AAV0EMC2_9ASTE|nr:unnamed protein product [Cuscuta epithymum]
MIMVHPHLPEGFMGDGITVFSARSDQESDAHSVRESESIRRPTNQPRRPGQSSEHDGLLGSGSFPRPSVYTPSGVPPPKPRGSDQYQHNKSNEPYQPPRPYKAGPQSRRDATDSFNNETFGSDDSASHDKVEEERRRRASFELMRKEQHKTALPKKQLLDLDKTETDCLSDPVMPSLAEDVNAERKIYGRKELDASTNLPETDNDSGKSSLLSQGSASRPLIPPGFRSALLEKDSGHKALIHPSLKQAGKPETAESLVHSPTGPIQNVIFDSLDKQSSLSSKELCPINKQLDDKSMIVPPLKKGNQIDVSNKRDWMDENIHHPSGIFDAQKLMENPEIIELGAVFPGQKFEGKSKLNQSSSILDKIFGGSVLMDDESENQKTNPDDKWNSRNIQSSKFAHWFSEEDNKQKDNASTNIPKDVLPLVDGGDVSRPQVCDDVNSIDTILSNALSAASPDVCEPPQFATGKDDPVPTVLTCEDLEQTILSEYSEKSSNLQSLFPSWSTNSKPKEQREEPVDDHASQHLLSLLQKGPDLESNNKFPNSSTEDNNKPVDEENHTLGKAITLETLFGSAFMNELQSMQAPVSVGQKDGFESQTEANLADRERTNKIDKTDNLLGLDDSQTELNLKYQNDWSSYKNSDSVGLQGFQLPEDESLIFSSDNTVNPKVSPYGDDRTLNQGEFLLPSGSRGASILHGARDHQVETKIFHNLPAQPSASLFHPMQYSQGRSSPVHPFETLPSHSNSHMKFLGPDITSHQFSGNMMRPLIHHAGFDLPNQHSMQMQGNYPHMLHDRMRSGPAPRPGGNQPAAFFQERNQMLNFPFGVRPPRQPSIDGFGIPMPADIINGGGNQPPEAIQRRLEMELRGSPKQIHPFAATANSQGMYGHELDMGLRYR